MELILINDSKLKIMLTSEDMIKYDLDCNSASYDNTETRRAFWSILDEAKHHTGFDAASERVLVQLFPSKSGGCEMYITKVGLLCPTNNHPDNQSFFLPKLNEDSKTENATFIFKKMCSMISACKLAIHSGNIEDSCAWVDESGLCYLFTKVSHQTNLSYFMGIMSEFGIRLENSDTLTYIKEHGHQFCTHNAIETLAVL